MEKNTSPEAPKGNEIAVPSAIDKLKALARASQEKRVSAEKGVQVAEAATLDESAKEAARMEQGNVKLATNYVKETKMFLSQEEGGARVPLAYNKEGDVLRAKETEISSEVEELGRTIKEADDLISSPDLTAGGDEESTKLFEDARAELQTMRETLTAKEGELAKVKNDRAGLSKKWTDIANETHEALQNQRGFATEEVLKSKDPKFNKEGGWEISEVDPGESKKVAEKIPGILSKERDEKQEKFERELETRHVRTIAEQFAILEDKYALLSARFQEGIDLLKGPDTDKVRAYKAKIKQVLELRGKKYGFLVLNKEKKRQKDLDEEERIHDEAQGYLDDMTDLFVNNDDFDEFNQTVRGIFGREDETVESPAAGRVTFAWCRSQDFGNVYFNKERRVKLSKMADDVLKRAQELNGAIDPLVNEYKRLLSEKMPRLSSKF